LYIDPYTTLDEMVTVFINNICSYVSRVIKSIKSSLLESDYNANVVKILKFSLKLSLNIITKT